MAFTVTSPFGTRLAAALDPWMTDDLGRYCEALGAMFDPVLELVGEWGSDGDSTPAIQNEIPNPNFAHDGNGHSPIGWETSSSYRINSGATAKSRVVSLYPQAASIFGLNSYCIVETPGEKDFEGIDTGEVIPCVAAEPITVYVSLYDEVTQTTQLRLGSAACGFTSVTVNQVAAAGWKRHSITLMPTATGLIGFSVNTHPASEQTIIFTAVSTTEDYFDGDDPGFYWTGIEGDSASRSWPAFIPAWGRLLDPDLCPAKYLPYLAQFVGVEIPQVASESEGRALIKEEQGFTRGTLASVEVAVRKSLTGEKAFQIIERRNAANEPDPYHFLILVYSAGELPSQASLEANVNTVKPGGVYYTIIVGSLTYAVLEAAHGTYAELEAAHTTYTGMEANPTA